MTTSELQDAIDLQYRINDHFARTRGLPAFLDATVIASYPEPKRFSLAADPWQRELLAPKIPAIQDIAGFSVEPYTGPRSFLSILPRGHDKSSLEGRIANFLLAYSRRRVDGYIVAADKDQGRLIIDAMRQEASLNKWYGQYLDFSSFRVDGPAGAFEVVPADAGSAYGFRGNVFILDEVTHWKPGIGQQIFNAITSGRQKRPGSLLIGIMNAWVKGTWQEEYLINVAFSRPEKWATFYRTGNLASWMTEDDIAETRALLPPAVARRVLDNIPIDPVVESGYLEPSDVRACVDKNFLPHSTRHRGHSYVLSVDYGPTKDRTVLVVMHRGENSHVYVDEMQVWEGKKFDTGRVGIEEVNRWIDDRIKRYRPVAIVVDPYEMEGTIQRLENRGDPVVPFKARAGRGNMDLAMTLRNLIMTHKLHWQPDQGFIPGAADSTTVDEMVSLVTRVMPYGWRLDHTSGKHDDRAVALGMGAVEVLKHPFVPYEKQGGETVNPLPAPQPAFSYEPLTTGIKNPLLGR